MGSPFFAYPSHYHGGVKSTVFTASFVRSTQSGLIAFDVIEATLDVRGVRFTGFRLWECHVIALSC